MNAIEIIIVGVAVFFCLKKVKDGFFSNLESKFSTETEHPFDDSFEVKPLEIFWHYPRKKRNSTI